MKLKKQRVFPVLIAFFMGVSLIGALELTSPVKADNQFRVEDENHSMAETTGNRIMVSRQLTAITTPALEIPLFGYKLVATEINPIERDDTATLKLTSQRAGFLDIEIGTSFRVFHFYNVPVKGEVYYSSVGESLFCYEINDPFKGFFMSLYVINDRIWVNIAFDGGESQLSYDGVIPTVPSAAAATQKFKQHLRQRQERGVIIYNAPYLARENLNSQSSALSITWTNYGIVHESYDFGVDYPNELPDQYWEPHTGIDTGIYRYMPSEAQIKSDLQYYNKDFIQNFRGYVRDILAYTMGTHGGPQWYIYEWQQVWVWDWWPFFGHYEDRQVHVGTIYPSEVENLWYHYYDPYTNEETDVHPWNSIVLVDVCYGYSYGANGNPDMAHAFVDDGAAAFVGSTISIPAASDTYMRAFWNDLCQGDETVETATTTLCDTYGNNWNLGDEWRILGDSSATLQN